MNHLYSVSYNELSFAVGGTLYCGICFVYFIDTTDVQMFNAHQNSGKIYFTFEVAINSSIVQFMVNLSSSTGMNVSIPVWRTSDQRQLTKKNNGSSCWLVLYLRLFARDSSHNYVFTNIAMSVNVTWSNYSSPTLLIFTPSPTLMLTSPTPMLTPFTSVPITGEL